MGCGCGKKRTSGPGFFMGKEGAASGEPTEWGPILWKYLHCLAEKIGTSGDASIDRDQAVIFDFLLKNLAEILPCQECQAHAREYIKNNPTPQILDLKGTALQSAVRAWLFNFHNDVRIRKQQPILISTLEECSNAYKDCFVPNCEYTLFKENVVFAIRNGWVKIIMWKRWLIQSERIKLLTGNVVV